MIIKRIEAIEFGVLSPQQIRKLSAIEIKNPETYDKDGYPMEGGLMDPHLGVINPGLRCKTCGQKMKDCPGHFGHIELIRPVIHPEFSKKIEELLHATCKECGKIMITQDKLELYKQFIGNPEAMLEKRIVAKTKKLKQCPHCGAEKKEIFLDKPTNFYYGEDRIYPTQIREWLEKIKDDDLRLMGYNPERLKPEWFIITALLVPPIAVRPSITLETGIKSEDDLTHKLVDIIRINLRLKDNIEAGAPQLIIEDLWDLLQYHVTTYFNNNTAGIAPAKHRSGRPLRTLVQRLQGKRGRFRYNLTGKRVNFAARSTVTPDIYLSINEVGVPEEIANELTVSEFVTKWNIKEIKELVKHGKVNYIIRPNGTRKKVTDSTKDEIIKELDIGFKVERILMNGDIVLFNRQPSLHRLSMMAHTVKVMPGRTLRLNPIVCKPYNADFDGDEMNLHVPQTEEGKTEARELMLVEKQVISPRYGAPVIILDEDGVSGCFILTLKSTKFTKAEAERLFYVLDIKELPKPDIENKYYSGKLIFSQLLPKGLNLEYQSNMCKVLRESEICKKCEKGNCPYDAYVKIVDGKLVSGVIDALSLGEGKGKLVDEIARVYGPETIRKFYDGAGKIAVEIVSIFGMTVGLDEYEPSEKVKSIKAKALEEGLQQAKKVVEKYEKGTLPHLPGKSLEESFEITMMRIGNEIKQRVEKEIIKEKVLELIEKPRYNSIVMILSGSRGSVTNLTNLVGLWGQAAVREGRPKRGFKKRAIALLKKGEEGLISGGFIENNFMDGMNPIEYFFHSMGGRQGEVDTGVSTKVSGYLYRRLANSLKDLSINQDLTVRTASKDIVQFLYGEDGVFPKNTKKGKSIEVETEIEKII
ncbi:MAG: DNA-directed RNA polymerase subunit A' [Candidatus Diapherotrites archaeon]|nr:DNA-directed RNA polymerase subunit A' [Candidatus Diapherotrites archaeon]